MEDMHTDSTLQVVSAVARELGNTRTDSRPHAVGAAERGSGDTPTDDKPYPERAGSGESWNHSHPTSTK